jgi:hypothetical protein
MFDGELITERSVQENANFRRTRRLNQSPAIWHTSQYPGIMTSWDEPSTVCGGLVKDSRATVRSTGNIGAI